MNHFENVDADDANDRTVVLWKPFLSFLAAGILLSFGGCCYYGVFSFVGIAMIVAGLFLCGKSQKYIRPSALLECYGYCGKKGVICGLCLAVLCLPIPLILHMKGIPDNQYRGEEIAPGMVKCIFFAPPALVAGGLAGLIVGCLYARIKYGKRSGSS